MVKKTLVALAAALVLVPAGLAARDAEFPNRGVLRPGVSLGGVHIGDTLAKVKRTWGSSYKVCPDCKDRVWFYFYSHGEPLGAAVRFDKDDRVVAAFTLGSPSGWRTAEGLLLGEQIDRVTRVYGSLGWQPCIGYGAMTMRKGDIVTSIYTTGQVIYGFALTAPKISVCQ
jgi:hypothetical protein